MNPASPSRPESLEACLGLTVVMDTAGPMIYIGTLRSIEPRGYWLDEADVHDRTEGHAGKELYVCEARRHGVRANRHSVFVYREVVISLSLLKDVIVD